ncbi:hypothetical protein EES44_00185 [Streptomyces sp. ADI96-15]|nr:hypothetical protein [Streptomyces sp. ADI96-15]RPK77230.1 hypothetical protein EES44_00185 [Streptomyces sp. ADI96-15]
MVSTVEEPLSSLVSCEFNPPADGDPPTGVSLVSPRPGAPTTLTGT